MKPAGIIGIILIVIGIIALALPFPPVLGGICLVGGIVLVIVGNRTA